MAKMMLTSRNATSMEQLQQWITDWLKMDKEVINKLCSIDGHEVSSFYMPYFFNFPLFSMLLGFDHLMQLLIVINCKFAFTI